MTPGTMNSKVKHVSCLARVSRFHLSATMNGMLRRLAAVLGLLTVCFWACLQSSPAATVNYTYDTAGRLIAVDYGGGQGITYTYDANGRLTQRQVVLFPDTDGDLMDDNWEATYFGNLSRNGTGDFDSDGMSDLAEFLAGTLPNNATSLLQLTSNTAPSGNSVTIQWQSVAGKAYRVQYKDDLNLVSWSDLSGDVTASGTTAMKTDTTATGAKRFYRVVLVP